MVWLLKRDINKSCKHLVRMKDKYCVLHVTSLQEAIELLMIGGVIAAEFETFDKYNSDHITPTAMCWKVNIQWTNRREREREGNLNKVTYWIKHFLQKCWKSDWVMSVIGISVVYLQYKILKPVNTIFQSILENILILITSFDGIILRWVILCQFV